MHTLHNNSIFSAKNKIFLKFLNFAEFSFCLDYRFDDATVCEQWNYLAQNNLTFYVLYFYSDWLHIWHDDEEVVSLCRSWATNNFFVFNAFNVYI